MDYNVFVVHLFFSAKGILMAIDLAPPNADYKVKWIYGFAKALKVSL
jgi:hypothetical protein